MALIAAGAVALEQGICRPGWVETSGGQIVGCGSGLPPRPAEVDMPEALVVPGFVDIHVHGGGGASYTDGNDADILRAAMFHRSHGTTTTLASLVTASPADLLTAVYALADSTRAGTVAGIHLEGPWRAPRAAGRTILRSCATRRPLRSAPCSPQAAARSGWSPWHPSALAATMRLPASPTPEWLSPWGIRMPPTSRPAMLSSWARRSAPTSSTQCGRCTTVSPDPRSRCCRMRG